MREINFRAWNDKEKFLDTAWSIDFEHGLVCHRAHNESDLDDCLLMQCTERKDARGRKIYEGDILGGVHLYIVEWDEENVMYVLRAVGFSYGEPMHEYDISKMKIVGNIFENSELLKEETE